MSVPILIVDDDPIQLRLLQAVVNRMGHEALLAESGQAALDSLGGARADEIGLVILDLTLPDIDGLTVLKRMRDDGNNVPVIVQTAQESIDTVINAMRIGAFDYFVKPAAPDKLQTSISNALKVEALKVEALEGEAKRMTRSTPERMSFQDLITRSETMQRVIRLGQKAAASNIPIIIEGESGVGKGLVALAIHGVSDRKSRPFVTVNCGAIPEKLVESTLFGHENGALIGASDRHTGKFVEAHGGTLFLDEIGDLSLDVQVKLLRAVQDGEVEPLGAHRTTKVDIRLISSTHHNLNDLVRESRFREDLFYRLNVFPIFVPPLRDRRDDIPLLVQHFINRFKRDEGRGHIVGASQDALAVLNAYDWPGNIRQLENAVFRAVVLCEGDELTADDFPQIRAQTHGIDLDSYTPPSFPPAAVRPAPAPAPEIVPFQREVSEERTAGGPGSVRTLDPRGNVRSLAEIEEEVIRFAVSHYRGQMSEVARRLGIGRSTLYRKLKEYGIDIDSDDGEGVQAADRG